MSHEDDFEEEEGVPETADGGLGMEIQVKGSERVEQAVVLEVARHFEALVERTVRETIEQTVREKVNTMLVEIVKETLRPVVEQAVADGWPRTNEWGEGRGERVTAKQRISEILSGTDRYSGNSRMWIDTIARETLDKVVRGEFEKTIADAREKLKAQFDEVITAKFAQVVKGALGLTS